MSDLSQWQLVAAELQSALREMESMRDTVAVVVADNLKLEKDLKHKQQVVDRLSRALQGHNAVEDELKELKEGSGAGRVRLALTTLQQDVDVVAAALDKAGANNPATLEYKTRIVSALKVAVIRSKGLS